jgi:hypothetical protein
VTRREHPSEARPAPFLRQLVIPWPEEWKRLELWYRSRGHHLFRIPVDEEGVTNWGVGIGPRTVVHPGLDEGGVHAD